MEADEGEFLRDRQQQMKDDSVREIVSSIEYRLGKALLQEIEKVTRRQRKRGFSKERIRAAAKALLRPKPEPTRKPKRR